MRNRSVWLCLILLILGRAVLADTVAGILSLDQLVAGLNLESQAISNGEAKILFFEIISPTHTREEAKQWLEERKAVVRSSDRDNNSASADESQLTRIFSTLELQATLKTHPELTRRESDIAFEVYNLEQYKYRSTVFDRRQVEKGSLIAQHESTDWQRIITFDGEIQVLEKELQNGVRQVYINSGDSTRGFIPCYAFGRIPIPLRVEQVEFVEIENSEEGERYVLKIQPSETEQQATNYVKVWLNPETYMITRVENYTIAGRLASVSEFRDFSYLPDSQTWYPSHFIYKAFNHKSEQILERHYVTIDAQFNIEFPSDFFDVDLDAIRESGIRISPESDIQFDPPADPEGLALNVKNVECGTQSLLRVCEIFKVEATLEELNKLASLDPETGTSFLGLHQAATKLALAPKAVRLEASTLSKLSLPAIMHIGGNHFIVVEKIENNTVDLYDPNSSTKQVSLNTFLRLWTGNAMVFTPANNKASTGKYLDGLADVKSELLENLSKDSPKALEYQPLQKSSLKGEATYDFGVVIAGTEVTHQFTLKNIGQESLIVSDVVSGCSCTTGLNSTGEIPPGKDLQIQATFQTPMRHGNSDEALTVYLKGKESDKSYFPVKLLMKGKLLMPFQAVPKQVFFGKVPFGESRTREIGVRKQVEDTASLSGVDTTSEYIKTKIISTETDGVLKIEVALLPDAPIGNLETEIRLNFKYGEQPTYLQIPVTAIILGDVEVLPKQVFFGNVRNGNRSAKTLELRVVENKRVDVNAVKSQSKYVKALLHPIEAGKKYQIRVEILETAPAGELSDVITVTTDSPIQPKVTIPLYAYIR